MKITTKTGDGGQTSLRNGLRVNKDDPRIELNGELDTLNALLGWCKVLSGEKDAFETMQQELMACMAIVACCGDDGAEASSCEAYLPQLSEGIGRMEEAVERLTPSGPFAFVLPGRNECDAALHIARTQVRTCERRWVALRRMLAESGEGSAAEVLGRYLNRLSDYLYCLTLRK